jgi:predicted deacylase
MTCGKYVTQGQTVGHLHDFYRIDEAPWPVQAGVDGYLLGQALRAPVVQGAHILVVAIET